MRDTWLEGKNVWITGASGGIGQCLTGAFGKAGACVTAFDRESSFEAGRCRVVGMDLRSEDDIRRTVRERLNQGNRPDVLVNAAGMMIDSEVLGASLADWDEMLAINFRGPVCLIQEVAAALSESGSGAVINIGSNAALTPRWGMCGYGASKSALRYMTMVLGLELAEAKITCNLVSPGSTDTPMQRGLWRSAGSKERVIGGEPGKFRNGIPLGKIADPEDITGAVLFLASPGARHITMQEIVVDGGAVPG